MATGRNRPSVPESEDRNRVLHRPSWNPHAAAARVLVGLLTLASTFVAAALVLATPPSASFTAPATLEIGQSGTFTSTTPSPDADGDTITTTEWDFDDDGVFDATGTSVGHAYNRAGTKTVRMRVTDSAGEQASTTRSLTVTNKAPRPSLVIAPNPARPGQTVNFDAQGSSDPDPGGSIVRYEWDLDGNGSYETDSGGDATVSRTYSTAGRRDIGLRVTDLDGTSASTTVSLLINTPPVAAFTALGVNQTTPNVPDVGETVNFNGSGSSDADGPLAKFEWDLDGNGSFETDTGTTPTTVTSYASRGTRNVKLRVTDGFGITATASVALRINAKPVARGLAVARNPLPGQNPQVPLVGQEVALASASTDEESTNPPQSNNSIVTHQWAAGSPPFTDQGIGVVHPPYATAGNQFVALRVTDNDGAVSDAVVTIRVNTPPVANFVTLPQTPLTDEAVTFTQTASDPDDPALTNPSNGVVTKYEWDLDGDGAYDDATGPQATTRFPAAGQHTVGLRVEDGGGARATVSRAVTVVNTRPTAALGSSPQFPLPGQEVAFASASAPSPGKAITKQEWDFDYDPAKDSFAADDVDAEGASARHAFPDAGRKTIGLRVTEAGGGVDIATATVIVNAPPQASFRASPSQPHAGDEVTLSSTSSDADGPIDQAWDTDGDGAFDDAAGAVATRRFTTAGSYTVRLRVTDDRGASAVHTGRIGVAEAEVALPVLSPPTVIGATIQIAGRTTRRGARITRLRVRTLAGARVTVKCARKGCPARSRSGTARRRWLRFKRFQRNLRAGVRLTVIVRKSGYIGRYVRFKIRRKRSPTRVDRCLEPGKRPTRCPQ